LTCSFIALNTQVQADLSLKAISIDLPIRFISFHFGSTIVQLPYSNLNFKNGKISLDSSNFKAILIC
jgi:hypothetical protein